MTAHAASAPTTRQRTLSWSSVIDAASYWTAIASVYIAYGFLWYFSAKAKLFDEDGTMPAGLAKAYHGTVIDSFPGVNASWLLLGLLEAVAFLVVIASLARGEFLPNRAKPILLAALTVSMFTFAVMTFGQNLTANYDGVASLFTYMGVTGVVFALLRYVPMFGRRS
jgi:hypothetical protein